MLNHLFSMLSVSFFPCFAALVIGYGIANNYPVYDIFIEGAKKGLKTTLDILPYIIGIYFAVGGLTASGMLSWIFEAGAPFFENIQLPRHLLPLILLRPVSGSGSFILLEDILKSVGPDSYAGRVACVMSGGCETVIYVLALYFSVTDVKKTRHSLLCGLIGYLWGVTASLIICRYL